jgi:hypothetical protein
MTVIDIGANVGVAETRVPIPMNPGRPICCDYEFERNGTANLFMMFAPLEGWRAPSRSPTAIPPAHVLKHRIRARPNTVHLTIY